MERIQFLCIEECPTNEAAWNNLQESLARLDIQIKPERIVVNDDLEAEHYSFLGSPSIKVDGVDLWDTQKSDYHMGYRAYETPHGMVDYPTVLMIMEQLANLMKNA